MSKKNDRDVEDIMKDISELEGIVNDIGGNMEQIQKDMLGNKPDIDFSEMEKAVDLLTKAQERGALSNPDKGDTDEEYDYYISDTLKEVWELVEDNPNNMALGKKVRQLYHDNREATPDSIERVANEMRQDTTTNTTKQMELFDDKDTEQLELFDDPATKDRKRWGG
tara:strand:- start:400 stop:900 length:501 start_codon:yes stop_codon:yes gene_type:complete